MSWKMGFGGLMAGAAALACVSGCFTGLDLAEHQADALRAEIEEYAADRSSTQDSDCGVVALYDFGLCDAEPLVYSRATVDEDLLLTRVEMHNDFQRLTGLFGGMCLLDIHTYTPSVLVSRNGVCVLEAPPPAIRDTDLVYGYSGGFAGISHVVRITPDGQVFVSDDQGPENPVGMLSNEHGNELNALLWDWDTLPAISEEPVCCDMFGYAITYRGRTLSRADEQANVPARLWAIAGSVVRFEQDP